MRQGRHILRAVLLVVCGLLSTLLTAGFFASLGTSVASAWILGGVGVAFEGLKIIAWENIRNRRRVYLWLAIPCTVLSLAASCGYASLTLEEGWTATEVVVADRTKEQQTQDSLAAEAEVYLGKIKELPLGYSISAERFGGLLQKVRAEQAKLPVESSSLVTTATTARLAVSMAKRFGWDGASLVTLLLVTIAIVLEVGIIVLVFEADFRWRNGSRIREHSCETFLEAIVTADGKVLSRRRMLESGWAEREIREFTAQLKKRGILEQKGRGSPLQLGDKFRRR